MRVIIAPDSFKGSLSSLEAAESMAGGVKEAAAEAESVILPAADGGEGTMEALVRATGGRFVRARAKDPLGREKEARYGILGDGTTCVIEMAEASGLTLLREEERNPLAASSFGTGMLIHAALEEGFRKFIIGLGGSATVDGGAGIIQALGGKLLDGAGEELAHGGGALGRLADIDLDHFDQRIKESAFLIASDVTNPLAGLDGAAFVFGPQKGASIEDVQCLDRNLALFAEKIEQKTGILLSNLQGAGAAGGAGAAFLSLFPSRLQPGVQVVLEASNFDFYLQQADLVLTGEGKSDRQTLFGKAPYGISQAAQAAGVPVILISGSVEDNDRSVLDNVFRGVHALTDEGITANEAFRHASRRLKEKTAAVVREWMQK